MNCEQAKLLIEPYADGELDAGGILELEQHLKTCSACSVALREAWALHKAVKSDALYFAAPAELRRSIRLELRAQNAPPPRKSLWNWSWLTAGSLTLAAACVALLLTVTMSRPSARQALAGEIVSSHVRSLMANHALDVVSSDQHTVKPWFDGKLDFAPTVKDLAAQGFPLAGGRLDYLAGHPVAALIFQRHKHTINLFSWPDKKTDSEPEALAPIQGFNLVRWSKLGMTFWAVSDLNEKELLEFARAFQE